MRQYSYHVCFMAKTRRFSVLATVGTLFLVASGCGKADTARPVATAALTLNKTAVPLGSPVELTYRFEVAADAKIDGDYRVFVHVNRDDGTMIWSDDHDLPAELATSQWKPGQVIQYTRTRFVPAFSYLGTATIEMGLYRDEARLPLAGPFPDDRDAPKREYKVATLDLLPRSENIQIIRLSGWHAGEFSPEDATQEWQWTQKLATLRFRNPRKDITFYLEFDTRADLFADAPQQITISSGQTPIETFGADRLGTFLRKIPVEAGQLGTGEMAELHIEVDRTFVPSKLPGGSGDVRELGIRVYHAYIEPR
jgi:hypothetical protein